MDDEDSVEIVYQIERIDCHAPKENAFNKDIMEISLVPDYIRDRALNLYNLQLDSISFRDENRQALIALLLYYAYCSYPERMLQYYLHDYMIVSSENVITEYHP